MSSDEKYKSPSEKLADLVVAKLEAQGLIPAARVEEVRGKITGGSASRDDWQLWIELAQEKQTSEENDGKN